MKKNTYFTVVLAFCIGIILVTGIYLFVSKSYYPNLPVDGVSKREAIQLIKNSKSDVVMLTEDSTYQWLIYKGNQLDGRERLIERMARAGWEYTQQEGAGYFFVTNGEQKIITSQMWTKNYVLYKVPKD